MFKKLTIPNKILFSSVVVFILLLVVILFSIYSTKILTNAGVSLDKQAADLYAASEIKADVLQMKTLGKSILVEKNKKPTTENIDEFNSYKTNVPMQIKALEENAESEEEIALTKKYAAAVTEVLLILEDEFFKNAGKNYNKWTDANAKFTNKIDDSVKVLNELINKSYEIKTKAASDVQKNKKLVVIVLILGIFSLLFFIILNAITIRSIQANMKKVISVLTESAEQIHKKTKDVLVDNEEVIQSTTSQAKSITETTASVEEITGMVNNNLENSKTAAEIISKSNDNVKKANNSMNELSTSMTEILEANERITQLVNVISNIGEKTEVMNEIVFQTKLLSFNASVEAERAGEHGRGFAVVAQEVGNLAQMSGKASSEIAAIVRDSIKQAESVVTYNKQRVENGSVHVLEVSKELQEISLGAIESENAINQILSASKEQSIGIKQINIAMNLLDKAIQENALAAKKSSTSTSELTEQSAILIDVVNTVNSLIKKKTIE